MISTDTMTLGRFVRVTLSNFRQLIRTINAPITSPMTNATVHLSQESASPPPSAAPVVRRGRTSLMPAAVVTAAPAVAANDDVASSAAADMPAVAPVPAVAADITGAAVEPDTAADTAAAPEAAEDLLLLDHVAATGLTLPAVLESLLFVAEGGVEPAQLARTCGLALPAVEQGLAALAAHYRTDGRGLRLQERAGRYQLVTAPETGAIVEAFLQVDMTARLSGPALETLAVIAYRQPVTRAQIEAVRGVDCSGVLRSLMQRGLIEETGRLEAPGRPVLYGITDLFLNHFGLTSLHELPPLAIEEQDRMDDVLSESVAPPVAVVAAASGAADRGN